MKKPAERTDREALALLGEERFVAFIRHLREADRPLSIGFMNERLDTGASMDDLFVQGEFGGYYLAAEELAQRRFRISFGYSAPPLAGDGGTWDVLFDEKGHVVDARDHGWVIF